MFRSGRNRPVCSGASVRRGQDRGITQVIARRGRRGGGTGGRRLGLHDPQWRIAAIDASRIATVERGTMVSSVVATGKIEPITKVEIKSKANGIIKALNVDVDLRRQGRRRARRARQGAADAHACAAPSQSAGGARRARGRGGAARRRTASRPKGPDVEFARAQLRARPVAVRAAADLPRRRSTTRRARVDVADNRKRAAQSQLGVSQAQGRRGAGPGRAGAGRRRPRRRGTRQRHHPRADSRHRALARRRDRQPGLVDPQSRRERHAGDDARRHRPGLRPRQGRRGRHRPRAARPAGAHPRRNVQGPRLQRPRHADLADGRREGQRHQLRGARLDRQPGQGAQGQHDGERRDRPRRARRTR